MITALERREFNVNIEPVSTTTMQRWRERDIELADQQSADEQVHLLIGADQAYTVLQEKRVVDGEAAWSTKLGWMLSCPQKGTEGEDKTTVAFVNSQVEALWQLEEPLTEKGVENLLPAFPLERTAEGYEVGLLWKNTARPADNRNQALAAASRLVQRLELSESRKAYDKVILQEYADLKAIEEEPCPDIPGYYMPHHAVVKEAASTTKCGWFSTRLQQPAA